MSQVAGPIARILLRYVGGALIAKAGLSIDVADPDLVNLLTMLVGIGIAALSEGWYWLARKMGWST